jgi:hypothetical protein
VKLTDYFPKEEAENAACLIHEFHDRMLLDDKPSDKTALLLSLYMCSNEHKKSEIEYGSVKDLFVILGRKEENFGVNLFNAKKEGLIDEKEGKIKLLSLKIAGLKAVKDLLGESVGVKTRLIESGKVYSGKRLFQEMVVSQLGSTVQICDPYCGARILDLLSAIKQKSKVQILTQVIEQKEAFKRELADFSKEFPEIEVEVRVFHKRKLHDRYLISGDNCWSIGSSLKDLGNKDTTVTKLEDEVRFALEEIFEKRWLEAAPLA